MCYDFIFLIWNKYYAMLCYVCNEHKYNTKYIRHSAMEKSKENWESASNLKAPIIALIQQNWLMISPSNFKHLLLFPIFSRLYFSNFSQDLPHLQIFKNSWLYKPWVFSGATLIARRSILLISLRLFYKRERGLPLCIAFSIKGQKYQLVLICTFYYLFSVNITLMS